jgi:hypothetical protein
LVDESECYIDATFASAQRGSEQIGPTGRSPRTPRTNEVTLVQLTFDFQMIEAKPENLGGDRAASLLLDRFQSLLLTPVFAESFREEEE